MKFRVSEQYRLEIHWEKAIYAEDDIAELKGCYLNGPVLKNVDQLNDEDYMDLDFQNQYIIFTPLYYIARFSWNGVNHTSERIYLYNVFLSNKNVNAVPKLSDDDYIVVDTKNHENEKHQHALVYTSYLIKENNELYKFEG